MAVFVFFFQERHEAWRRLALVRPHNSFFGAILMAAVAIASVLLVTGKSGSK
jgi:hypothetical protein